MICKNCKVQTDGSLLEQDLGLCFTCGMKNAKKFDVLFSLMEAEKQGILAAREGLLENNNPFTKDNDLYVMWLNGWQSVDLRRETAKTIAMIVWSRETLLHVKELADGYNQEEISSKLDTVLEKLEDFIDER